MHACWKFDSNSVPTILTAVVVLLLHSSTANLPFHRGNPKAKVAISKRISLNIFFFLFFEEASHTSLFFFQLFLDQLAYDRNGACLPASQQSSSKMEDQIIHDISEMVQYKLRSSKGIRRRRRGGRKSLERGRDMKPYISSTSQGVLLCMYASRGKKQKGRLLAPTQCPQPLDGETQRSGGG